MIVFRYTPDWARILNLYPSSQPALLRLSSAWITNLCIIAALAHFTLPQWWGGPAPADLHLGSLFLAILLLRGLTLDMVATAIVGAVMLLARLVLGPSYWLGADLLASLVLPLLVLVILNSSRLIRDVRRLVSAEPLAIRLLRSTAALAMASVPVTLYVLLERGYRPELEADIAQQVRRKRFRQIGGQWRNWGRTAASKPQVVFYPETLNDLVEIVGEARATGKRIRVVASGHSWSSLAATDDVLVVSHGLNKISVDLTDPTRPLLVAEAGATVNAINTLLEAHGLTLPFNVVLESVRIGGLVATGSHGSGWDTPTLSDLVERIEVVQASGDLVCYSTETHGPEVMSAVRLSLGVFGIIYRLHIRVEPNYRVRHLDRRVPVETMLREIATLVPQHENLDLYYWPYQDNVTIRAWDRTEDAATAGNRKSWMRHWGHTAVVPFHATLQWTMRTWQRTTPAICGFDYRWLPHYDRVTDVVEAIHWRSAIELLRVSCVEFAFKLTPDFTSFYQAWQAVISTAEEFAAQGRYPFNMTLNVRFIGQSDCLLAPAGGPGHTCYIEILSSTPTPGWEEFASAVASQWMKLPGARPHWAKEWEFIPDIVPFIGRAYGNRLQEFLRIHAAFAGDFARMFSNELIDRVIFNNPALLEPERTPVAAPTEQVAEVLA